MRYKYYDIIKKLKIINNNSSTYVLELLHNPKFLFSNSELNFINRLISKKDYKQFFIKFDNYYKLINKKNSRKNLLLIKYKPREFKNIKYFLNFINDTKKQLAKNELIELSKINSNQTQIDLDRFDKLLKTREKYNINKIDNIIDFINYVVYKNEFNCSVELMEKISETLLSKKIYLTYSNYMNLGLFLGLFLEKINLLKNTEEENFWKYIKFWNKIIHVLDKKILLKTVKGYFRIPIVNTKDSPEYLKDFYYTNGQREKFSHYIQGAYLERVLGTTAKIEGNKNIFNPHSARPHNPYCQYYFYGETILPDAIENILAKHIETKTNQILDEVETSSLKNYFNKKSVCCLKIDKLFIENNSLFILNYVRTPTFLNDIYEGYFQYLKNEYIKIEDERTTFVIDEDAEQISIVELQKVAKIFQLSFIEEFLTIFTKKNEITLEGCLKKFKENAKRIPEFNNGILDSYLLKSYLNSIVTKLINFSGLPWKLNVMNIRMTAFTENFFILKSKSSENVGLFGDKNPIIFAYYPINKDKICFFTIPNIKNNKFLPEGYISFLCNNSNLLNIYNQFDISISHMNKALSLKDKIMLNQKRNPFTVVI